MDLSDLGGAGGWLSNLLGGGGGSSPTSLAAPGIAPPTPDSAGLPVNGTNPNDPSLMKGIAALGSTAMPKQQPLPQAPTIQLPQTHQQPYAQALAQVMAQLNAKPQSGMLPQGTQ